MNAQEIFDKVAVHLITQGHQSKSEIGECEYRSESGDRCAIGCLISNELYQTSMEGKVVSNLINQYAMPNYFTTHAALLNDLQEIHDSDYAWPTQMINQEQSVRYNLLIPMLTSLAIEYNLTLPKELA